MDDTKLCKNCKYFSVEEAKASCYYEYFKPINIYRAIIYIPESFDCEKYKER